MASTLKCAELLRSHSEGYFLDRITRIFIIVMAADVLFNPVNPVNPV